MTPNQPNCSTLEHGTSVFNRLTKAPEQSEWLEQLITLTKCVEAIAAAGAQCLILTAPTQSARAVFSHTSLCAYSHTPSSTKHLYYMYNYYHYHNYYGKLRTGKLCWNSFTAYMQLELPGGWR